MTHAVPKHDDPTEIEPRPQPAAAPTGHSTGAQLRRDVESGATGDKTPMLDPAASPLGTDDEAAGQPTPPRQVDAVRRHERETRPANAAIGTGSSPDAAWQRVNLLALLVLAVALALLALTISFG